LDSWFPLAALYAFPVIGLAPDGDFVIAWSSYTGNASSWDAFPHRDGDSDCAAARRVPRRPHGGARSL